MLVMGNVHHLQHLGQGTGSWNAWRKQESDVRPDLTSANLRGANLSGMDLSGSLLSLADLRKANLAGACLKDCSLPRANLEGADLSGTNLQKANMAGAWLLRANLSGASMRMANLAGANLAGKIDLSGADLTGANLAGAKLMGANFSGATLIGANLAGVDAREANFTGADLTDAVTAGARLDDANMSGAIIRQTMNRQEPTAGGSEEQAADERTSESDDAQFGPTDESAGAQAFPDDDFVAPLAEPEDWVITAEEGDAEPVAFGGQPEPETNDPLSDDAAVPELDEAMIESEAEGDEEGLDSTDLEPSAAEGEAEVSLEVKPDAEDLTSLLPPATEEPIDLGSDGSRVFRYETKDMAILALYSAQIGRKTKAEKAMLLDLLVQYNKNYFGHDARVPMTISGNAILAGFDNSTDALQCGGLYIKMLRDMHVESYVAINLGRATVRVDTEGGENDELIADSVSPVARLMPVGTVGEVLVLEDLYSHPQTKTELFTFERVARKWKTATDLSGDGMDVICYSVRSK